MAAQIPRESRTTFNLPNRERQGEGEGEGEGEDNAVAARRSALEARVYEATSPDAV
jgi:hypothetical protein